MYLYLPFFQIEIPDVQILIANLLVIDVVMDAMFVQRQIPGDTIRTPTIKNKTRIKF